MLFTALSVKEQTEQKTNTPHATCWDKVPYTKHGEKDWAEKRLFSHKYLKSITPKFSVHSMKCCIDSSLYRTYLW